MSLSSNEMGKTSRNGNQDLDKQNGVTNKDEISQEANASYKDMYTSGDWSQHGEAPAGHGRKNILQTISPTLTQPDDSADGNLTECPVVC